MRGRDKFKLVRPLIWLVYAGFRLMPRGFASRLWTALDVFTGSVGAGLRYALAKRLAKSVGESVLFGPQVYVNGWDKLDIGNNVSIHRQCYIDASGGLVIGNDVSIAHQSSLLTFEHTWDDATKPIRENLLLWSSVIIEDDVWIGCGSRILAGASIGTRTIVAAGAVVTKSFSPGVLIGGVPAKVIKEIG